jgi:hypothetical protein
MISERVLALAVERGLIAEGQAMALRSLAREVEPPPSPEPDDPERFRFVTGFADIFVTIGLALFLGSLTYFVGSSSTPAVSFLVLAAAAWGLAEFFTRRRRMALPSIVLLLVFVCSAFVALAILLGSGQSSSLLALWGWGWGRSLGLGKLPGAGEAAGVAIAAFVTTGLAALHYWRFRVPITVAAGVSALSMALVTVLSVLAPELVGRMSTGLILVIGLAIFTLAMRFDLSDPHRETRRTDIAFWLHLLAAPMIVHTVFQGLGVARHGLGGASALLVLVVFAGLAFVAILVDRRALLVSGLLYAGWAFASIFQTIGLRDVNFPLTILALGAFVLGLSAGWMRLRAAVIGRLPSSWARVLPAHGP